MEGSWKLRILILSEFFYPHGSGGALATYLYSKILAKTGCKVIVVTNKFPGEPTKSVERNVIIYRFPLLCSNRDDKYSVLLRFDAMGFIGKLLKWADLVYITRYWFSAIPLSRLCGKRVVTHVHGYVPMCPLGTFYDVSKGSVCDRQKTCSPRCILVNERQERGSVEASASMLLNMSIGRFLTSTIGLSDAIICVSEAQRDLIVAKMPWLSPKIHVIHNPLPRVSYVDMLGDDFAYFGGPHLVKGYDVLHHSLDLMRQRGVEIRVHCTNFENCDLQHPRRNKSMVLYGRLGSLAYRNLYTRIRAVIVPSAWMETFGYATAEALLRGRLVIASMAGGVKEITRGCPGVFYFQRNDPRGLMECIDTVRNLTRDAASDLGLKNRKVILKTWNSEKVGEKFVDLLTKIVDQ